MHALPLEVLPEFERRVEALFTDPVRCRKWSGRYWFPWEGEFHSNPQRAAANLRAGLAVGLGLSGLRLSEVLGLRVRDVGLGAVFVRSLKRGFERTIVMGERWFDVARRFVFGRELGEHLFLTASGARWIAPDLQDDAYALAESSFGLRLSFHCLRHTAALRMYHETRDVLAVRALLGHRHLSSTWAYLCRIEPVSFSRPPFSGPPVLRVFGGDLPPEVSSAG